MTQIPLKLKFKVSYKLHMKSVKSFMSIQCMTFQTIIKFLLNITKL
jgi:hypothetical protein